MLLPSGPPIVQIENTKQEIDLFKAETSAWNDTRHLSYSGLFRVDINSRLVSQAQPYVSFAAISIYFSSVITAW